MGDIVMLHVERWFVDVYKSQNLHVDVSSHGQVRFRLKIDALGTQASAVLTMEEMARLGEALSHAYKEDDDDG